MIVETHDFELIAALEARVPEFERRYDEHQLEARLQGRESLALIKVIEGEPVAYKVGYAETPSRFYSWVGGVAPEHRRRGYARELMHYQEEWCRQQGYREISVWSENRYRNMLIFLLTEGYDIYGCSTKGQIMFRKSLKP